MTYLLDISTLMALLWGTHEHNAHATDWQNSAAVAVCPLTELGFLRISTQPALGCTVQDARKMLSDWKAARNPAFVLCDVPALDSDAPPSSGRTTDFYLASLAEKYGMRLATLDEHIGHKAAFLIPELKNPPVQPAA